MGMRGIVGSRTVVLRSRALPGLLDRSGVRWLIILVSFGFVHFDNAERVVDRESMQCASPFMLRRLLWPRRCGAPCPPGQDVLRHTPHSAVLMIAVSLLLGIHHCPDAINPGLLPRHT